MPVWWIDGRTYDLTEFMPKHPGGAQYLAFAGNDVTITFFSYHRDPKRSLKALEKYRVEAPDARPNKSAMPDSASFQLPEDFDYGADVRKYNFDPDDEGLFLNACRGRVNRPEHLRRAHTDDLLRLHSPCSGPAHRPPVCGAGLAPRQGLHQQR